jgi:hypothetical protein
MAANDIELQICRDFKGSFVFCDEYSLKRKCSAGAVSRRCAWPLSHSLLSPPR